jgi:DnaJ-class molecular chaperone
MRGMERWGVGTTEQAFAGYKALEAGEAWYDVLGCAPDANAQAINARFRELAQLYHPDKMGGSEEAMIRLNRAREEGLKEAADG